jgi:hypothetical protein
MAFGLGKRGKKAKARVGDALAPAPEIHGPSPDPMTNLLLADIVLRGAGAIARQGVERALLGRGYSPEKAKHVLDGRTLRQSLFGGAIARVATHSVPGAIMVGGGMVAKTLYDRHRDRRDAHHEGNAELERQAKRGRSR